MMNTDTNVNKEMTVSMIMNDKEWNQYGFNPSDIINIISIRDDYYLGKFYGKGEHCTELYGRINNDLIQCRYNVRQGHIERHYLKVVKGYCLDYTLRDEVNTPHEAINDHGELDAPFVVHEGQHVKVVSRWGDCENEYQLLPTLEVGLYTPTYDPYNSMHGVELLMYDTHASKFENLNSLTNTITEMVQAGEIVVENFLDYHADDLKIIFQEEFETVAKQLTELFYEMNN